MLRIQFSIQTLINDGSLKLLRGKDGIGVEDFITDIMYVRSICSDKRMFAKLLLPGKKH